MTTQNSNSTNKNATSNNTTNTTGKKPDNDPPNTTDNMKHYVSGDSSPSSTSHRF